MLAHELYKVHTSTRFALDCYDHIRSCRTETKDPDCHLFTSFFSKFETIQGIDQTLLYALRSSLTGF